MFIGFAGIEWRTIANLSQSTQMHVHHVGIVAYETIVWVDGCAIRIYTYSTIFIVDRTNRLAITMNVWTKGFCSR